MVVDLNSNGRKKSDQDNGVKVVRTPPEIVLSNGGVIVDTAAEDNKAVR